MSFFKTLQRQPRIISLFTNDLELNKSSKLIYQVLESQQNRDKNSSQYQIEIHDKFPTLDQLKYMCSINPMAVKNQIPNLSTLIKKKTDERIFGSELKDCVKTGEWNDSGSVWVDWEKKRIGNDPLSIKTALGELQGK